MKDMQQSESPTAGTGQQSNLLPVQRSPEALAMFRHDMMTPINLIMGYAEMLDERVVELNQDSLQEDIGKITIAARKLLMLIDEHLRPSETHTPPAPRQPEEVPVAPVVESAATRGERFLVVDDDAGNQELLTRFLAREGYSSMTAGHGVEALSILAKEEIDMILLDVQMPEMNGFELLERLKGSDHTRHIPVIMVSAFAELEKTAKCIELGAEDYLTKPFNSTLLLARVSACLEKKRLRDAERKMFTALAQSRQALADELKEAATHVLQLLPPPRPGQPSFDWRFLPSTMLGGDAFGYFDIDADRTALFLLDVCGHGVRAALHSILVMSALRGRSLAEINYGNPSSVMAGLNKAFQMSAYNDMYFTIWYGVYDRKLRHLSYSSAGHPAAVMLARGADGPTLTKLTTGGPIIGMLPDMAFKSAGIDVKEGSKLFVFSDGTYELRNADGDMLTVDAFERLLATTAEMTGDILDGIVTGARKLQGRDAFEDDFSILMASF